MSRYFYTVIVFLCLNLNLSAEVPNIFSNNYIKFTVPPGFKCKLDSTEWICQPLNQEKSKEAVIIFAAKIKGAEDNLHDYEKYLEKPKIVKHSDGKAVESKLKFTKIKKINGHEWVDSLHLGSEIPQYYTRYLATEIADLGVVFTFSVSQKKYRDYIRDLSKTIVSLEVFRNSGELDTSVRSQNEPLFPGMAKVEQEELPAQVLPNVPNEASEVNQSSPSNKKLAETLFYVLALLLVTGVLFGYRWIRRRG